MKQTAVEWLEEKLYDFIHPEHGKDFLPILEQAKQMEKEQIEKAYLIGCIRTMNDEETPPTNYYNETYKNTDE